MPLQPLAVRNGRMPAAAPKKPIKRHQGPRPRELQLCKHYEEMGRCPLIGCIFAHGAQDLAQRELDHAAAERAMQASKLEAQEAERAQMAALAAPERLGPLVLAAMRAWKLAACVRSLQELGVGGEDARRAARAAGGDAVLASSMLFDGGLSSVAEVDVESEEQQVLSMASVLGTSRQDIEKALLDAEGDWEFVMQECQTAALRLDSAETGREYLLAPPPTAAERSLPPVAEENIPADFWAPVTPDTSHWVDPVSQPEWFSRPPGSAPALGHSANGSRGAAAAVPASTDVFGVGTPAAAADWQAPEPLQEPAAAFQYASSDFMGMTPGVAPSGTEVLGFWGVSADLLPSGWPTQNGAATPGVGGASDGYLQPGTPAVAEAAHHHAAQSGLTDGGASSVDNEGAEAEEFEDLLAMLTM